MMKGEGASIMACFASLEDPRIERSKRHKLLDIIAIAICATICGADSWVFVELFGRSKDEGFRSLVLPEVLRAILTRALLVEGENPDDVDEGNNWHPWIRCVRDFYRDEFPQMSDDPYLRRAAIAAWIDEAVAAFTAKRFRAKSFYEGVLRK